MSLLDSFDPNLPVSLPDGRVVSLARLHIDLCVELADRVRADRAERDRKRLAEAYADKIRAAAAQGPQAINLVYAEQQREAQAVGRGEVNLLDIVAMADDPRGITSIIRFAGEKSGANAEDVADLLRSVGVITLRAVAVELLSFPVGEKENPQKPEAASPSTSGNGETSSGPSTESTPASSHSADSSPA